MMKSLKYIRQFLVLVILKIKNVEDGSYADEFKHNKKSKIFEYYNSWLRIFDFKVFYLPYFNHPILLLRENQVF